MLRILLARIFFVVCFGFDALEHAVVVLLDEFALLAVVLVVVVLVVMATIPFDVIIIDTDSGV
jgi:hypothetical protein